VSQADLTMGEHATGVVEDSPFAIPSKKLVMWLFIISDSVTFGALLYGYGYLRHASPDWPHSFRFSPSIINVMVMTFVLVTSSLTMLIAVDAAKSGNQSKAIRWALTTVAGGILFAFLHVREWVGLIGEGLRPSQNPWGSPLFGAAFFGITGMHLLHVLVGIVVITAVTFGYKRGRYRSDDLETWGLYWHFVDVVWMFVVPLVYLLNVAR
jgi:cytochrome c oxidase subunit 3